MISFRSYLFRSFIRFLFLFILVSGSAIILLQGLPILANIGISVLLIVASVLTAHAQKSDFDVNRFKKKRRKYVD